MKNDVWSVIMQSDKNYDMIITATKYPMVYYGT